VFEEEHKKKFGWLILSQDKYFLQRDETIDDKALSLFLNACSNRMKKCVLRGSLLLTK
jgi:hypothetical protein